MIKASQSYCYEHDVLMNTWFQVNLFYYYKIITSSISFCHTISIIKKFYFKQFISLRKVQPNSIEMDIFDLWKQLPNLDIQTPTAEPEQIEQHQQEKVPLIVDIEESAAYFLEIWIRLLLSKVHWELQWISSFLVSPNLCCLSAKRQAVSDGWFIMLEPLKPGQHARVKLVTINQGKYR